ncbi:MAG: hypothetical protein QNJ12_14930 [Ilumatobacter sp.]|uniref:hypothetical protein n=1 Tax=Ilumatobacter sp. TaxID=1967498 RepID=UPI002602A5D8|nr:hypothetical protein [Ilumatobacter sp.]MDJ0770093.1 hypothetical protein [Ilumatobacter sp.]
MTLFDVYVVVDWSASSRPVTGENSIWIATAHRENDDEAATDNPPTRAVAERGVRAVLDEHAGSRVLLAIDATLGLPAGSATLLGWDGPPWSAAWREIADLVTDDERNGNNRFEVAARLNRRVVGEGPFWGCPPAQAGECLSPTKPVSFPVAEFRTTERELRRCGWHPKSVWQLLGAGSVGGQTLTVLPMLERLRADLGDRVEVWPFTTGLAPPATAGGSVVIAEVWPTLFGAGDGEAGPVKDARQVSATAATLRRADRRGALAGWFAPTCVDPSVVVAEEGWVLSPVSAGLDQCPDDLDGLGDAAHRPR